LIYAGALPSPNIYLIQQSANQGLTWNYAQNGPIIGGGGLSLPLTISNGGTGSSTQNFVDLSSIQTVGGNKTFTNNIFAATVTDQSSLVFNPLLSTGSDMCAQISTSFATCIAAGYTSCTVDARRVAYAGQQNCAGSPFAGVSNNGSFTGTLLTQNTQIVTAVPIVVPGGIRWDGTGPRSLVNPPRNFAGTTIQPSTSYATNYPLATNPIIQMGATSDTSSPQKIWLTNLAVGCVPPGGAYTAGTGSMAIFNGNGQEGSGGDFLQIFDCQYAIGVDTASSSGVHSGFDSSGFHHVAITVPADAAAGCIQFGNTAMSAGATGNVPGFEDITCTGAPSGTEASFGIDIEGSNTWIKGLRCAYINKCVIVGNALTAVNIDIASISTTSNVSYPMTTVVELDSNAGFGIVVRNVLAGGTTTNILTDANYPGGACTLVAATEGEVSLYARGTGGGASGVVISTNRTACIAAGLYAGLFTGTNTFTGPNYMASLYSNPTGTALNSTSVFSGTYTSGGSISGSTGQTCTLSSFNNSSTATATVALTGSNTIAGGTALVITSPGTGATAAPTSATLGNGTATCSGTATIITAVGPNYNSYQHAFCISGWNGTAAQNYCGGIVAQAGVGVAAPPAFIYKINAASGAASTTWDFTALSNHGITFPTNTFMTNSSANTSQYGLNIASGLGIKVANTAFVTDTISIATGSSANTDAAGSLTLSTGTKTYSFSGTYATAPICVATDTTSAAAVQVGTTTTVLTVTGTGSDVIYYICIPRT